VRLILRGLLGLAVLVAAGTVAALPTLDATAFIIRAADIPGTPATVAGWRGSALAPVASLSLPTRGGDIPARLYAPADGFSRTIVLVPGVHRDGIDEQRLVALAGDLAESGYAVVTVAAPDLQRFRITPEVTDVIEDAAAWAAAQPHLAPDGRVGLIGISFSGGLSVVAAGRPSIRDRVAFVVSFGGHGDLWRVLRYLTTGEVMGDLERARLSNVVLGAEQVQVQPPHDYGLAVVLLTVAASVVPHGQVAPLVAGVERFLLASSLAMVDQPRALTEFAAVRTDADQLPEPARTLLGYVNDRAVTRLGAVLAPVVDTLRTHPAMPALSAERAPAAPAAPVYLLHGADDNVIPSVETVLLGEYLSDKADVHGLLSGLITHAELNRAPTATDVWRLASFWRQVFGH
jgi:hypothetical protein